jgi:hypothetical protein
MQTWYMYEYKIYIRTYKKIEKKPKKHHIYKLVCIKKSKKKEKTIYTKFVYVYILKTKRKKKTELNRKEKNKKKMKQDRTLRHALSSHALVRRPLLHARHVSIWLALSSSSISPRVQAAASSSAWQLRVQRGRGR